MKKSVFLRLAVAASALFALAVPASASFTGHKVETHDADAAQTVEAQGGQLIANYGGFRLYDVPKAANLPASAEVRDHYNSIFLNAAQLDTSKPEIQALRKSAGTFAGKRMHLIQFAGPIQPKWRKSLLDAGVQIVSYIPHNAYLVYGDASGIGKVQALAASAPHIQWEGAYLDDYKIHPLARTVDKNGKARDVGTDRFAIQLMADPVENAATLKLIDQLKFAPIQRQRPILNFVDIVVRLSASDLAKIAAQPDVVSIQPYFPTRKVCERQDQIVAGNLSGNDPSGPGYLAWLESKGFSSSQFTSFVIDVSDSGIDNGTTLPNHFGLYPSGNTSGASRVMYNVLEGTPNPGSTLAGCDGHGNLNTHIISGYDNSAGFPFADSSGYHFGLGVCPFAQVGSSVIFDPDNSTNPDDTTVISKAYGLGARISNNSWGGGGNDGTYSVDSFEYDALVRDAEPGDGQYPMSGNQEMVIVFAAGNDGPTNNSVSPPGTAKNVITVGAAQNVQPFDGCDSSGVCDSGADNANSIINFSGRGPCNDGRRKPDLVAPGTHVSGGAPQETLTGPTGDGSALSCFLQNGDGVSGGVGTNNNVNLFFPDKQQFYTASSGTSHSTPCVTGGCALVRQYFLNNALLGTNPPSPAMTKAFLMNSARYMDGAGADDTLWSDSQGMGEMDLGMAFDGTSRILRDEATADTFTASGQTRVFTGVVGDASLPFRVTVAWTDAPGSTTGNAFNNDLDLTVEAGGVVYKGNNFTGSNSISGGVADAADNVESVFLPPGVSGNYKVTVTAANINSIGVPNPSNELSQDFALVVYNSGPEASIAAAGAMLTNEPCGTSAIFAGETVNVNLALQNIGNTSTTNLVATLLTTNGVVFPSAPQSYGALPSQTTGSQEFSFFADGECGQTITAVLQLQDGPADLGVVTYTFQLGTAVNTTYFTQDIPGSPGSTLPTGWQTDASGGLTKWVVASTNDGTTTNAFFCPDAASPGEVLLYSPTITTSDGANQLIFSNSYNLEPSYDGGVLEIAIGSNAIAHTIFSDILAAGGSFVTGGYNGGLSDLGDRPSDDNPLIGRQSWTGTSDGFVTTVVNLPAAAAGTQIQLRWICGTDAGNAAVLSGPEGWWITGLSLSQPSFDCAGCSPTNTSLSTPTIFFPTNSAQLTAISPVVTVTGLAPADNSSVIVSNNGARLGTTATDENGVYAADSTLIFGTNTLSVSQGALVSATNTVVLILGPPVLNVPAIANPQVAISGEGAPGAIVSLYEGTNASGTLLTNFTVDASGQFAGSIMLALGNFTLTATEAVDGQTSANSPPASVSVVPTPPPTITSPENGLVTNKPTITVSGKGLAGAALTVYNLSANGSNKVATTVSHGGRFSVAMGLGDGQNTIFANQTQNGTSPNSDIVNVMNYLAPQILIQPVNQTNFVHGTVTFTAEVVGATPLKMFWEKNSVKIPGADTANLTLSNLKTNVTTNNYCLIVSNKYGVINSSFVTVSLVPNPFTNLAGMYYGLFAESNAQFDSSGLLTLSLNNQGKFSAKILNAGGGYGFTGYLSGIGWGSNLISRGSGKTPLNVVMNLDISNGTEQILGQVNEGTNWVADLEADRATFSRTNLFPGSGKYTMVFAGTNSGTNSPGGNGYATVNATPEGMISLNGVLSDGMAVASSPVSVSKDGEWPLYIPLYGRFGSLEGWIDFTNQGPSLVDLSTNAPVSFAGTNLTWFRTNSDGKLYPRGFTNSLTAIGSGFSTGGNAAVLDLPALEAMVNGGNLADALSNSVIPSANGKFSASGAGISGLMLKLNPANGTISGSFSDAAATKPATIKGVVLQDQTNAGGFFLGGANSGSFLLTPP